MSDIPIPTGVTDFLQNNVDLSGYFPAYEVLTTQIVVTSNYPTIHELQLTLTRNKNGITNYIVLSQPYITLTNYGSTNSRQISHAVIYKKTATTFSATINTASASPPLELEATIWFVVVYPYSSIQPIINSLDYYDSAGDPIDFFPQYMTSSLSMSSATDITLDIDLTPKSTDRTDYICFGSLYDTVSEDSASTAASDIKQIMYYTVGQTGDKTQIKINKTSISNIDVETLVLYPIIISTNDYTSNYFVKINNIYYSLSTIFPLCEVFILNFSNKNSVVTTTFTLTANTKNTTNYVILASYVYNSSGSGGTYNPFEGSSSAKNLLVTEKTTRDFTILFEKTTGDTWNGGIRCLVIYL